MQQRLAERRRSRVGRASSVGDQSLSFNFGKIQAPTETIVLSQVTVAKPVVQQSRMQIPDKNKEQTVDDSTSLNKSVTSQGAGLANKIGLAISRILSNSVSKAETDDDVADLIALIQELNHHTELTVKLNSTNRITKILNEVGNPQKDIFAEIQ